MSESVYSRRNAIAGSTRAARMDRTDALQATSSARSAAAQSWLARASLYIGNDSGITHLAAAVGTPVLAMFGPTDPAVWAPRGPNVRVGLFVP